MYNESSSLRKLNMAKKLEYSTMAKKNSQIYMHNSDYYLLLDALYLRRTQRTYTYSRPRDAVMKCKQKYASSV